MRSIMKKLDFALLTELTGVILVAIGVAMFSVPLALVTVGGFLIWATEKAN
jgi:hypothetical protein